MSDFSNAQLRRLDLTLLLILLALLRLRRASAAAAELGLTPSAVSQALRRLRDLFGDPLFLRRPHGLEPTALALALEGPVAAAVEALRGALGAARAFDPAAAQGVLRVAAIDAEQAVLIPPLAATLAREAPGLRVIGLPLGRGAAMEALRDGRADLALGFFAARPDWTGAETLYAEGFLVAGRPEALPDAPALLLEAYVARDHVLVSPGGDLRGVVDAALAEQGLARRVTLALPGFLPALAAAAQTGALTTIPARVAARFGPGFGLALAAPPLPVRAFSVCAVWHARDAADGRTLWLRGRLRRIAAGISPSPPPSPP